MSDQVIQHQPNVHEIRHQFKNKTTFQYLLISDIHYDADDCHRDLLKKHLRMIKAVGGQVLIIGDWFDVMGCYKDPRSKAESVRPEYISKDKSYLDAIIDDAASFLKPYADNIALIGYGNHESAIKKHRDTDPLKRLAQLLNIESRLGGYSGYVKFQYYRPTKTTSTNGRSIKLAYHHGYGGSKRSKGILNAQIDGFTYPDADIIVSGHDHNKLHDPSNVRYRLTNGMKIDIVRQHWLKLGSYVRNDTAPLVGGWHVEKAFLPRVMGGWFMSHTVDKNNQGVKVQFIEAQ